MTFLYECKLGADMMTPHVLPQTYDPTVRTPKETRSESLKFLIHFIGDIHQPLHVSGRGKGGNDASVRFNGVWA